MSTLTLIIIAVAAGIAFFFVRRLKAARKSTEITIEKVKAATYIRCPHCGAALEVELNE